MLKLPGLGGALRVTAMEETANPQDSENLKLAGALKDFAQKAILTWVWVLVGIEEVVGVRETAARRTLGSSTDHVARHAATDFSDAERTTLSAGFANVCDD